MKLEKNGNFIYNILSVAYNHPVNRKDRAVALQKDGDQMFNFRNNKTKRIVSAVIIVIVVLAMVVPIILSYAI